MIQPRMMIQIRLSTNNVNENRKRMQKRKDVCDNGESKRKKSSDGATQWIEVRGKRKLRFDQYGTE